MMDSSNLQDTPSVMESVCVDDEIFFGPITAKERMIKERFEKRMQARGTLMPAISNISISDNKNDISEESYYESFSAESKYDSFEDSLNEDFDLNAKEINVSNFLSEQVNVNVRKLHPDNKNLVGYFCDSLEDIHSLVSNADKFSTSEEIEGINVMELSYTCDDSLRNDICIANKNTNSIEQYLDDDSLAIFEKTFDDSLEDSNGPISHIDSLILSRSKVGDVDSSTEKQGTENQAAKSYFETSIEVIYENSKQISNKVRNLNENSQSISDCNLSRDSLEEISELPNQTAPKPSSNQKIMPDKKSENVLFKDIHNKNSPNTARNNHQSRCSIKIADVDDLKLGIDKVTSPKILSKFLEDKIEQTTSNTLNFNDTICIDDSILPSHSILSSPPKSTKTPTNIDDAKFEINSITSSYAPNSNDTICIDDSVIVPYEPALKALASNFTSKCGISSDDLGCIEVENICMASPKPLFTPNSNDTICIDDSMIAPSDPVLIHYSDNFISERSKSKSCMEDSKCEVNSIASLISSNAANFNDTICIDDSIILPFDPVLNKEKIFPDETKEARKKKRNSSLSKHIEKNFQKLKISNSDKKNVGVIPNINSNSPLSHPTTKNTVIDIVVRSPLNGCQKNVVVAEHSNLEYDTKTPEKTSVLIPCTPKEMNLKLHIEVAVDKDQGVNIISVSSTEQGLSEGNCSSEIGTKTTLEGGTNMTPELIKQAKVNISDCNEVDGGLKPIVTNSQINCSRKMTSLSKEFDLSIENFTRKKNIDPNKYLDNFHINLEMHDAKLLQALDLHDSSYSFSEGIHLQSRDSIMPLNLCIRDKSFEKRNKTILRNESKENIPFISTASKFYVKELVIPNASKTKSSPKRNKGTPLKNMATKQQLNNVDVKKSGGKINSATKIPIRKVDNALPTPLSQKKLKQCFKPSSTDKLKKSLFVTPVCPSAVLHKEVSGETPRKPHHFCTIRNSISRVPKSAQKNTSKKFQNIQSPIAKYIGNPQVYTPLKTTHCYDGNLLLANMTPSSQTALKASKNAFLPETSAAMKADKKF